MRKTKSLEIKIIFSVILIIFAGFLLLPFLKIIGNAFISESGFTLDYVKQATSSADFTTTLKNSFTVSIVSALIATFIAFIMAYSIEYTNIKSWIKKVIKTACTLPMLLPTVTYGFAIIYSFGK